MGDQYSENFVLYKARNDNSGAVSQWNIAGERDCVFLEMAKQKGKNENGNATFGWDDKIRFKLGDADIGELLAVLVGIQKGAGPLNDKGEHKGLFHSNPKGNAVLYFGKDKAGVLRVHLSVKKGDEKVAIGHAITKGESCVLNTLLRQALVVMYRWQ